MGGYIKTDSKEEAEKMVAAANAASDVTGLVASTLPQSADPLFSAMDKVDTDEAKADINFGARCYLLVANGGLCEASNLMLNLATDNDVLIAAETAMNIMKCLEGAYFSVKALGLKYGVEDPMPGVQEKSIVRNREMAEQKYVELKAKIEAKLKNVTGA